MYRNYGDKDFFENGVLVDTEHSDTVFPMLLCRPYPDEEDLYQFGEVEVDLDDLRRMAGATGNLSWIFLA